MTRISSSFEDLTTMKPTDTMILKPFCLKACTAQGLRGPRRKGCVSAFVGRGVGVESWGQGLHEKEEEEEEEVNPYLHAPLLAPPARHRPPLVGWEEEEEEGEEEEF